MSFRPEGTKVPSSFNRSNNGQKRKQYERDILAKVISYNLATGAILAQELRTGREYEVTVDRDVIARINGKPKQANSESTFEGHMVDERMKRHIPEGGWVVFERTKFGEGRPQTVNGVQRSSLVANYIRNVRAPNPNKTFYGIFTISPNAGRIETVQAWDDKAIVPTTADGQISEELKNYGARLDAVAREYATEKEAKNRKEVGLGVRFRAVVPNGSDEKSKEPVFQVVDSSPPLSWIAAKRDNEGQIVEAGRPLDSAKMIELLNQYSEYLDSQFPQDKYPQLSIEVMTYRSFRGSIQSDTMRLPPADRYYDPINLMQSATKYSQDPNDEPVKEQDVAVAGIIELTPDQPDQATQTFRARNFAQRLYTHGFISSVHSQVKTAEGHAARPHPAMDMQRRQSNESTQSFNNGSAPAGASSAPSQAAQSLSQAADPFATDGADPFASEGTAPYDNALADAPAAPSAPVAPANESAPSTDGGAAPAIRGRRTM